MDYIAKNTLESLIMRSVALHNCDKIFMKIISMKCLLHFRFYLPPTGYAT